MSNELVSFQALSRNLNHYVAIITFIKGEIPQLTEGNAKMRNTVF